MHDSHLHCSPICNVYADPCNDLHSVHRKNEDDSWIIDTEVVGAILFICLLAMLPAWKLHYWVCEAFVPKKVESLLRSAGLTERTRIESYVLRRTITQSLHNA